MPRKTNSPASSLIMISLMILPLVSPAAMLGESFSNTLSEAVALKNQGKYREAAQIAESLPSSVDSWKGHTARDISLECMFLTGQYSKVIEWGTQFKNEVATHPQQAIWLARAWQAKGQYQAAEQVLLKAAMVSPSSTSPANLELARLLKVMGKDEESHALFLSLSRSAEFEDAAPPGIKAIIFQNLDRFRDANAAFKQATTIDPDDFDAWLAWGALFLEKYNPAEAVTVYSDILKRNPTYPAALVGLAISLKSGDEERIKQLLSKAIDVNPNFEPAYAARAFLALEGQNYETAEKAIQECFLINPNSLSALSLRAVLLFGRGDTEGSQRAVRRVLELNPHYGEVYEGLGHYCVSHYFYSEAVEYFQKSVTIEPRRWSAHAALGVNLLRVGQADKARQTLEYAFANDPYNVWAYNTLKLLDSYVHFVKLETPHFSIQLHQKEAALLELYVPSLLEQAYQVLSVKYGFLPAHQIYFEMFPDHEDFAVRALGVPGLGALGVCFGNGIVMDSPSARPKGEFSWGSTLWHEFTHVITIGITNRRVPRWFTEGLSIMEEKLARPGWGGNITLEGIKAIQENQFLPILDLDSGFLRPRFPTQIQLSYFQAGEICQWISQRFGFGALEQMLQRFKAQEPLPEVLEKVCHLSPEAFDAAFRGYLLSQYGRAVQAVDFSSRGKTKDLPTLTGIIQVQPDNFFANLELASYYRQRKEEEKAVYHLKIAKSVFPGYAEEDNPYKQLSQIYAKQGRQAQALQELEALAGQSDKDVASLKLLATWLEKDNRPQEAIQLWQRAVYVYPFDLEIHQALARLTFELRDYPTALREFRAVLILSPEDQATAHFHIANVLFELGNLEEARQEVLRSLDIAPGYDPAQVLLLKIAEARKQTP
ncbi:MAG: tetratricopeptide repeat protein [Terriglobia bacterium]